jgi:integrase
LTDFSEFLAVDLRMEKRTVQLHRDTIKYFLKAVGKASSAVCHADVRAYLHVRMKSRSEATVNNDLKSLRRFYRDFLHKPELVMSFRFKQPEFREKHVPSSSELKRFIEALPDTGHKALLLTLATCGWRVNEVLPLTWKDIDLENRWLIPVKRSSATKRTGTGFFNGEAEKLLRMLYASRSWKDDEKAFPSYKTIQRIWNKARMECGVKVMPQNLRQWFCTEMMKLGVASQYVDAFCGRVPSSILARHYLDYSAERLREIHVKSGLKVLEQAEEKKEATKR